MHIAVCIDNTANRKQMERLLHRASDKQPDDQVFYIDSYGSTGALMHKPMLYDLFLLDITQAPESSLTLAFLLRSVGVTCPIVLCPSIFDYQSQVEKLTEKEAEIAASFLFLPQPVKTAQLDQLIEHALYCYQHAIPTMELRAENYTLYVKEEEFLYAIPEKERVHIYLSEGREISIFSLFDNFYDEIKHFEHILYLSERCIVHQDYIASLGFASVQLKNGVRFRTPHRHVKLLRAYIK